MLYESKLEAERELYMELDVPDVDYKRHLYNDVLEGKPFTFTKEESRVRIPDNLFMTFLKHGGQYWALEDNWMQLGVATSHSASIVEFNCSPVPISVKAFVVDFVVFQVVYNSSVYGVNMW